MVEVASGGLAKRHGYTIRWTLVFGALPLERKCHYKRGNDSPRRYFSSFVSSADISLHDLRKT
jgi:hypothetical protein